MKYGIGKHNKGVMKGGLKYNLNKTRNTVIMFNRIFCELGQSCYNCRRKCINKALIITAGKQNTSGGGNNGRMYRDFETSRESTKKQQRGGSQKTY